MDEATGRPVRRDPSVIGRFPAVLRIATIVGFLVGIVGVGWYVQGGSAIFRTVPSGMPGPGTTAPDFTLKNADGYTVSLASYRGKTVIVNFWASWCQPCRAEMPAIDAVARAHPGHVAVLAVDVMEGIVLVERYRNEVPLSFVPLLDPDGAVTGRYHVVSLPSSFFIGPHGTVRAVNVGPLDRSTIEQNVQKASAGRHPAVS